MEFLNEKRIYLNGRPMEIKDTLLNIKVQFVEKQMEELKRNCIEIYQFEHYRRIVWTGSVNYADVLKRAQEIHSEIRRTEWTEDGQLLDIFKAKADCLMGMVYSNKGDYDKALDCLTASARLIETDVLQYLIPEYYIYVNIEMAKCYMGKFSPKAKIDDCLQKACAIKKSTENILRTAYPEFFFQKLSLELELQQLFTEMDAYGQRKELNEKKTWMLIRKAENMYEDLPGISELSSPELFNYEEWKNAQDVTIQTTKGNFFKSLYFIVSQLIDPGDREGRRIRDTKGTLELLNCIIRILLRENQQEPELLFLCNTRQERRHHCISIQANLKKAQTFLSQENLWTEDSYLHMQRLRQYCFRTAFALYSRVIKKDENNTISLDSMAALLYDYENAAARLYKETDEKRYSRECACLIRLVRDCCRKYSRRTVQKCIEAIVDEVLEIDRTNMFALNIKAAGLPGSSIPEEIEDYPALRQDFFKKRYKEMNGLCGSSSALQNIEMQLIILNSKVIKFMNSAIVDCSRNGEWRDLAVGHYTTMKTLPKLINKRADARLHIQNVHHLNDPTEGVIFINQLRNLFSGEPPEESNVLLRKVLEMYDSDRIGTVRNSVYMGSFTSRLDDLTMWDRYGDGGRGASIQFNAGKYFDTEAEVSLSEISTNENFGNYKRENIKYPLYMVIYLPMGDHVDLAASEQYAAEQAEASGEAGPDNLERKWWEKQQKLIAGLNHLKSDIKISLEEIQKHLNRLSLEADREACGKIEEEICNIIMIILDMIRFLVKSDFYRDEREFRVIQYDSDPECDGERSVVPHLYISVDRELDYKKVCFGPRVTDFNSKASYILNIKKDSVNGGPKENWEIEVCKSSIPYR